MPWGRLRRSLETCLRTADLIRAVEPFQAADVVDTVFAGLSEESRRMRFHVPMPRLPSSFRDRLARLDGRNHAAVAAWAGAKPSELGGRSLSPTECEMALAVADAWQGRGVGRSLLGELIDVALGLRVSGTHRRRASENPPCCIWCATCSPMRCAPGHAASSM